jgi:hypothetical protein
MAIVKHLELRRLEKDAHHTDADCTYSVILDAAGKRLLQIDTYGSKTRRLLGKKSQSIRFTTDALAELKKILAEHF